MDGRVNDSVGVAARDLLIIFRTGLLVIAELGKGFELAASLRSQTR